MATELFVHGNGYEVYNRQNSQQVNRKIKVGNANLNNDNQDQSNNNQSNNNQSNNFENQEDQKSFKEILEKELGKNIDLYF
jgi:protein required for attachment to host cells